MSVLLSWRGTIHAGWREPGWCINTRSPLPPHHLHTAFLEHIKQREERTPAACVLLPLPPGPRSQIRVAPTLLQWRSRSTSCKYPPRPPAYWIAPIACPSYLYVFLPSRTLNKAADVFVSSDRSNRMSDGLSCFESIGVLPYSMNLGSWGGFRILNNLGSVFGCQCLDHVHGGWLLG